MQLIPQMAKQIDSGEIWYDKDGEQIALHSLSEKEMQSFRTKEIAMIFQVNLVELHKILLLQAL